MNEIRRHHREDDEIARIREIVGRHRLPDFVTGFEVRLGDTEGEPAMWIAFKRVGDDGLDYSELKERAKTMVALYSELQNDLLRELEGRYPYFRSESAENAS